MEKVTRLFFDHWQKSKGALFLKDLPDGSGRIIDQARNAAIQRIEGLPFRLLILI